MDEKSNENYHIIEFQFKGSLKKKSNIKWINKIMEKHFANGIWMKVYEYFQFEYILKLV
jgi:hypothetical protein